MVNTALSKILSLMINMTTKADIYQRPLISKVKGEKETIQQGSHLGKASSYPTRTQQTELQDSCCIQGSVGATAMVTVSKVPSEP